MDDFGPAVDREAVKGLYIDGFAGLVVYPLTRTIEHPQSAGKEVAEVCAHLTLCHRVQSRNIVRHRSDRLALKSPGTGADEDAGVRRH